MENPLNLQIDHINGNRLDNRKVNLRICTAMQNQHNRKKSRGSSKYKGVSFHIRGRVWVSFIMREAKRYYLGSYKDEKEAAIAYNQAALKFYGEFALLNEV